MTLVEGGVLVVEGQPPSASAPLMSWTLWLAIMVPVLVGGLVWALAPLFEWWRPRRWRR